ncbi:hypothetical protein FHS24_000606 [Psychrobacter luti]|uniref:Uncharacterized protein n=1 Tax=Psychrobacter luti TaxID=198481 RepID=A0A839TDJ6_9GAMM|nr:hypothetical protein [Psychrobacter luti]
MASIFGLLVISLISGSAILLIIAMIGGFIKAVMYLFGHR